MTRNKKLVRLMAATIAATTVATSMPALAAFDANYYAKQNPDVVAAVGTTPKALENHYNTFGKKEGRAASAEDLANSPLRQIFDAKLYAQLYPDVVAVFGTDADKLFQHFMTFGINEGRKINQYFDVNAYKAAYPDLAKAFGDNTAMYYKHFVAFGIKEHRTLGGFPAENILPGGAKKVAASGGSSGGSSGGGSASSGGSSSGAVTPGAGLPTNVAATPAAVASANAAITDALTDDNNQPITSVKTVAERDALVASAQSTLKAAQAVNTKAQADKVAAQAEYDKADEELTKAESAVKNSKNDVVKTFDENNALVAAVGAKQTAYYAALQDLENKKEIQAEKAADLAKKQAEAKAAQAEYETALKNAKDTYVAVSGNPASYIENKKPADVITELDNLAGGKNTTDTRDAVNALAAKDKDNNPLNIIGADGKVDSTNYQAAVKKATDQAIADNLAEYQVEYLNKIITAADSYDANGDIKPEIVTKLSSYGVTATGWKAADIATNEISGVSDLPTDSKLATLTSSVIGNSVKINGKTVTEQETIDVAAAKKGIDDTIGAYNAAVSGAALTNAQSTLNSKNGDVVSAESAKNTADGNVVSAETALTNADTAVKDAEKARDNEYEKQGVGGNAELKARDAAQANMAKETYELSEATSAAQDAQKNEEDAYDNYNAATGLTINP